MRNVSALDLFEKEFITEIYIKIFRKRYKNYIFFWGGID